MKKKIFFQKCNFNYIFFLLYILVFFLNSYIGFDNYPDKFKKIDPKDMKYYYLPLQILHLYTVNLSNFLAIIPYLIRKRLLRKKEEKIEEEKAENKEEKDSPLIYNDNKFEESEKKKRKYKMLCIIVGVLDFLQKFSFVLFNLIFREEEFKIYPFSCVAPFAIVIQFVCSYFILKIHFYKLQYFSLFLNLGIFIIILIIDIINIVECDSFNPNTFYIYAMYIIFLSIELSYGKTIILEGFISVYLLMIIKGVVVLVFVIIFSLIVLLTDKEKNIFKGIGYFFRYYIWLIFVNIITHFLEDLFIWLIVDRFSPNYNPFAIIFQDVSFIIIDAITKTEYKIMGWDLYVRIALYVISFIGIMIHNEIVVINLCNLGSDTKYFLDIKVQKEEIFAKADDPEILKRFETLDEIEEKSEENENAINNEKNNSSVD